MAERLSQEGWQQDTVALGDALFSFSVSSS